VAAGKLMLLPVREIELDRTNPRIRRFLESYAEAPTAEQIALALDVAGSGEDAQGATTPEKLRNSSLQNGGIMQPIIVNRQPDGKAVCIEGNTRLYIYQTFLEEEVEGDWTTIPALVHEALAAVDIDAIRLQAHLVGPRAWDAYSKAKYLWELQFKELMPIEQLVAFCGGNRRDVSIAVSAYADMERYYRPVCVSDDFDTERYSGFVELQNSKVKDAILRAGFSLTDFSNWIRNNNIRTLQEVRALPRVLPDKRARDVFVKKNMKAALEILEKPELNAGLRGASISQLARALTEAIEKIPYAEFNRLRSSPEDDAVRYINDAAEALAGLIADLNKPQK
jgi:hypothetical protein